MFCNLQAGRFLTLQGRVFLFRILPNDLRFLRTVVNMGGIGGSVDLEE
jgi:hypothetical protein